jgi:hypothetical protein
LEVDMATDEHTGAQAPREDLPVAIGTLLFECRLTIEAARAGLQTLTLQHPAPLKSELEVVLRFVSQAVEAFEALAAKLAEALPLTGLQA